MRTRRDSPQLWYETVVQTHSESNNSDMTTSNEYLAKAVENLSMAVSTLFDEQTTLRRPEPLSDFILEALEHAKERGIVRLFTVAGAAEVLGVSTDYVYARINQGELKVVELGTGTKAKQRISATELQRFIDSRTFG